MEDEWYYFDNDEYGEDELVEQELCAPSCPKTVSLFDLMGLLLSDAEEVHSFTGLSLAASILLLQHCKWLSEDAKEEYYVNPEKLLRDLKLTADAASHEPTLITNPEKIECLICDSEADKGEAVGLLSCNHFFHMECWKAFIVHSLNANENLWNLRCPMDGCVELVDAQNLKKLFPKQEGAPLRSKIEPHLLSAYVDTSPRLSWCPNEKGCEGIIYTPKALDSRESVECNACHLRFCFHCKKMPHSPAYCDQVQQWIQKLDEEAPSMAYLQINTKGCPQCKVRIEKNQGCNHMTCKCGYQFCWICLGKWSRHQGDYFSCHNARSNNQDLKNKENDERKFYKYYDEYMIQKDSSKREGNEVDKLTNRKSDFPKGQANSYPSCNNPDFLVNLLASVKSALSIARERIAFAIVRSYYSDSSKNETQLFLYRTGSLKEATENLSYQLSTLKHIEQIDVEKMQEGLSIVKQWISILEK